MSDLDDLGFVPAGDSGLDDLGFEADLRPVQRTVLDEVQVEGTPEGTGTVTMGESGRVERSGRVADRTQPIAPVKEMSAPPSREFAARWEVESGQTAEGEPVSAFWDLVEGTNPVAVPGSRTSARARDRLAERGQRFWDQFTSGDERLGGRNPLQSIVGEDMRSEAPAAGFGQGLTFGASDELLAPVRAAVRGESQEQALSEIRRRQRTAREQAPDTYGAGETAGVLATSAVLPSIRAAQGAGTLARVGAATGTGAIYGGLSGFGHSEAEDLSGLAQDAGESALAGGLTGGLIGAGGEALRRATDPASRAAVRQTADEALLAATRRGGSRQQAIDAFTPNPSSRPTEVVRGEVRQAADALRRARTPQGEPVVPRVGSTGTIAERARLARQAGDTSPVLRVAERNARMQEPPAGLADLIAPSLGGAAGAAVDVMAGGGGGALGTWVARQAWRRYGRTFTASGLDWLARTMERTPQSFGRYGQIITEAAGRGPAALTATHYTLMQRDAEYRRLVTEAQEREQETE